MAYYYCFIVNEIDPEEEFSCGYYTDISIWVSESHWDCTWKKTWEGLYEEYLN